MLVKEAEAAEAIRLRVEASKFEAIEKSLQGELRVLKDYNTTLEKEKSELDVKVADLVASVKVREQETADLDAMVHELETSSAGLQEKVTAYENCMDSTSFGGKILSHLLTTITGRRWLFTYGVKLAIVKCLHSLEYLSALRAAISKAIEKGMQDDLATEITHGQEDVNFSLLAELRSNKDASTKTLINILCLDEPLAERLGLDESQPHVDQLDNIANHRSALRDVFVPLVEPLSSAALEGMEGTSGTVPETTMALSVTFASTSSIPPISTDDYDVYADGQEGTGADGQTDADVDVNPFPNVDDAELDIS
ncbi:hypothetical protein Tco_0865802 [Tanacetum coccineum]